MLRRCKILVISLVSLGYYLIHITLPMMSHGINEFFELNPIIHMGCAILAPYSCSFCIAGAAIETTLWSIEWAIAELVNHPEIQQKLRNELDTVLGPGVQITEPDTHKLPYLQAVIKETLRLRMAIPLLVPHMNLHDARLGGYDIPAESKILVNAWWLANNPDNWKKPEEFRPERFLQEEAKVEASGNDSRYLPFGVGRRSCPGIILALPILGITIGRLVQNFELLPPPGQKKLDTAEKGGQFSLHILKHSTIVAKPRVF